jgi:hypothetical protein
MKRVWMLIVALLFSFLFPGLLGIGQAAPEKQVVVVVVDGLCKSAMPPELTPNLSRLQKMGAIGVMNHNTLGAKTDVNSYLTIGAGSKAGAPFYRVMAYAIDERVREEMRPAVGRDLYLRHIGTEPDGKIVVPQLPQILSQAEEANSRNVPGLLGDAVHAQGKKTAVLGNTDLGSHVHRPAALIAMDSKGTVDLGGFQTGLIAEPTRPYGVRSDLHGLYQQFLRVKDEADLIVLETGDMGRLQHMKDLMSAEQTERAYRQALQEADALIGELLPHVSEHLMLAVISPDKSPLNNAPALTPVFAAGGDIPPGSLLTSGTTKREGLIANYDLAPTFVQFLGGDPARHPFLGQPMTAKQVPAGTDADRLLEEIMQDMLLPSGVRSLLIRPWLNVWIGLAALILLGVVIRASWLRPLAPLAELLLLFPLVWLYVPLFHPKSGQDIILDSLLLALIAWGVLQSIRPHLLRYGLLAGATVASLLGDMLLGAPLMKRSVFSYDPVVGARYYGIGNEYMGLLLGAALLFGNVCFARRPEQGRLGTLLLFFAIVCLFAAPTFGTNAGGALAAAVGGSYAFLQQTKVKMTARSWLWLGGGAIGGLMLLFAFNLGGEQTHIGRAAALLLGGDYAEVAEIAQRKIALNLHLLRVSAWGKLFVLFLALLLVWRVRGSDRTPFLLHNFKTQLVTAGAAFLFNDSGVVAAAVILLFAVVPLLTSGSKSWTYYLLNRLHKNGLRGDLHDEPIHLESRRGAGGRD